MALQALSSLFQSPALFPSKPGYTLTTRREMLTRGTQNVLEMQKEERKQVQPQFYGTCDLLVKKTLTGLLVLFSSRLNREAPLAQPCKMLWTVSM
jgi:hypothetical protein